MAPSSKKPRVLNNDSGFTLIEVLIAITILAFVSFSTYKMVDSNTESKERIVKEDRQTVQSLTATGRLEADISQMYTPLYSYSKKTATTANSGADIYADNTANPNGNFDGKTNNGALIPQFKSEDKSSIVFFTQANRRKMADSKESRFAWVKYSLKHMEPDPDNPDDKTSGLEQLVRQTITTDIYNQTLDWDKEKAQVVMERIKSFEFSFWDERAKKFTSSLQDLNEYKNIIRSIKVNIIWIDSDNNEQKISKVFRILAPYFNTKQDDLKTGGNTGFPPGIPDPLNPGGGSNEQL